MSSLTNAELFGLLLALVSLHCTADIIFYPNLKQPKCEWSEWHCKEKQTFLSRCTLFRVRNCSSEPYALREYNSIEQRIKGIVCTSGSSLSGSCLAKPNFLQYTTLDPLWCPWQHWQPWSYVCIDAYLEQKSSKLARILSNYQKYNNGSLWLRQRSRSCNCPNGRFDTPCSGPAHQAAFTPTIDDLTSTGELPLPPSRQSAWCPWSAWSGRCGCSSWFSARADSSRSRICRLGTATAAGCSGAASETRPCRCDEDSTPTRWKLNFFSKQSLLVLIILVALVFALYCICRTNRLREQSRLQRQIAQRERQQRQQQQQQELLQTPVPQPAPTVSPAAPAAAAACSSLNEPPPSYEEALKLVA